MCDGLTRRGDVAVRVEEETESDGDGAEVAAVDDGGELTDALREVDDPCSNGEAAAAVAAPGGGNGALGEVGEEGADDVRLLELAIADLDEVGKVAANGREQLGGEGGLALEEAEKRVLGAVLSGLKTRRGLQTGPE